MKSNPYLQPSGVPHHVSSHYLGVAALTLFTYDIFLTLDDEIRYLWKRSSFTVTDLLYFINRYYSLSVMVLNTLIILLPAPSVKLQVILSYLNIHKISLTSNLINFDSCAFSTRWSDMGSVLAKVPLDIWLLLKIYAMWNCNRKVLAVLTTVLLGNVVGSLTYDLLIYKRLPGNTGCAVFNAGGHFWVVFALSLTYEVVIVAFTLVWAVRLPLCRRNGMPRKLAPLAHSVYRSGVIYFVIMATVMGFMSITGFTPLTRVVLPSQLLCAMVSTIGARTMLSIHKVHFSRDFLGLPSDFVPSEIRIGTPSLTHVQSAP